jgi:hypothetical protein
LCLQLTVFVKGLTREARKRNRNLVVKFGVTRDYLYARLLFVKGVIRGGYRLKLKYS